MYCGDETGAYIGDVGAHTSRFGYGGEDNPKYVVPSYAAQRQDDARYIPTSTLQPHDHVQSIFRMAGDGNMDEPQVDANEFLQQGDCVQDWDAYEHVWQRSLDVLRVRERLKHTKGGGLAEPATTIDSSVPKKKVKVDSSVVRRSFDTFDSRLVHPVLAVSPGCSHIMHDTTTNTKQLEKYSEILFESLGADSVFVAPAPMLSAFAMGRQTCLVVDIGSSGCRVTPLVDGFLLRTSQRRNGRGGDWLGHMAWNALLQYNHAVQPRYQRNLGKEFDTANSRFHRWAMQDFTYELRTTEHIRLDAWRTDDHRVPFSTIAESAKTSDSAGTETAAGVASSSAAASSFFELPDGTKINTQGTLGRDLCRIPELLFAPNVPFSSSTTDMLSQSSTLSNLPLHQLIHDSLTSVGDADIRKELCGNIVLVGGSSLFAQLEQRLSYELTGIVTGNFKCRVLASRHTVERSCSAWIGASVLTSLGSFQQLWLSRTEYDEYGAALAIQRFP